MHIFPIFFGLLFWPVPPIYGTIINAPSQNANSYVNYYQPFGAAQNFQTNTNVKTNEEGIESLRRSLAVLIDVMQKIIPASTYSPQLKQVYENAIKAILPTLDAEIHKLITQFGLATVPPTNLLTGSSTGLTTYAGKPKLVCYYTGWDQWKDPPNKFETTSVDPHLCTHLIFAFSKINWDWTMTVYEDNAHAQYRGLVNLRNQNPDLKVLLAIGGWTHGGRSFSVMAEDPQKRRTLINDIVRQLREFDFDGFDLDWEYPGNEERGGRPIDKDNFLTFVKELREAFDASGKKLLLTAAVSAGKDKIDSGYHVAELNKYLDFINLLTYDFHGAWESNTGLNAPYNSSVDTLSLVWAIDYWLDHGMDKNKIIVGMPTYGRGFTLNQAIPDDLASNPANAFRNLTASGPARPGRYTKEDGILGYYELCQRVKNEGYHSRWDDEGRVPYTFKGDQWFGYDNKESLKHKLDYTFQNCLGGAMVWSLALDDHAGVNCGEGKYPLINYIKSRLQEYNVCGGQPQVIPTAQPPIPSTQAPTVFTCPTLPPVPYTPYVPYVVPTSDQTSVQPLSSAEPGRVVLTQQPSSETSLAPSVETVGNLVSTDSYIEPSSSVIVTTEPSGTTPYTKPLTSTEQLSLQTNPPVLSTTTTQVATTEGQDLPTSSSVTSSTQDNSIATTPAHAYTNETEIKDYCINGWKANAFNCTTDGTFRDPFHCGYYYECVYNSLAKNYLVYHRSCADPINTIFDVTVKNCVWRQSNNIEKREVLTISPSKFAKLNEDENACLCDIYNQIHPPTQPPSGNIVGSVDSRGVLPVSPGSTSPSSVFPSPSPSSIGNRELADLLTANRSQILGARSNDSNVQALANVCLETLKTNEQRQPQYACKTSGLFLDETDCRYYWECVPAGGNSYTVYHRPCSAAVGVSLLNIGTDPSTANGIVVFDPKTQSCVWSWQSTIFEDFYVAQPKYVNKKTTASSSNGTIACACNKLFLKPGKDSLPPSISAVVDRVVLPKEPPITLDEKVPVPEKGNKSLFCYYTSWDQWKSAPYNFTPASLDPFLCNYIIYAFQKLETNYTIQNFEHNYEEQIRELIAKKKINPALKVIVGLGGWNAGGRVFSDLAMDPKNRRVFIQSTVDHIRKYELDGIDLDWEYPGHGGQGGRLVEDKKNFPILVEELRNEIDKLGRKLGKRLYITAAVSAGETNIDNGYDIPKLAKFFDFIGVMTYDMNGWWQPKAGHNSPLYDSKSDFSISWAMYYWHVRGMPLEKLLIGIPTYGRTFKLKDVSANKPRDMISGPGPVGPYSQESGIWSNYEICKQIYNATNGWTLKFDDEAKVPYAYKDNIWLSYENEDSIIYKVKYLLKKNYAGAIVWDLALDDHIGSTCGPKRYPLISIASALLNIKPSSQTIKTRPVQDKETTSSKFQPKTLTLEDQIKTTLVPPDIFDDDYEGTKNTSINNLLVTYSLLKEILEDRIDLLTQNGTEKKNQKYRNFAPTTKSAKTIKIFSSDVKKDIPVQLGLQFYTLNELRRAAYVINEQIKLILIKNFGVQDVTSYFVRPRPAFKKAPPLPVNKEIKQKSTLVFQGGAPFILQQEYDKISIPKVMRLIGYHPPLSHVKTINAKKQGGNSISVYYNISQMIESIQPNTANSSQLKIVKKGPITNKRKEYKGSYMTDIKSHSNRNANLLNKAKHLDLVGVIENQEGEIKRNIITRSAKPIHLSEVKLTNDSNIVNINLGTGNVGDNLLYLPLNFDDTNLSDSGNALVKVEAFNLTRHVNLNLAKFPELIAFLEKGRKGQEEEKSSSDGDTKVIKTLNLANITKAKTVKQMLGDETINIARVVYVRVSNQSLTADDKSDYVTNNLTHASELISGYYVKQYVKNAPQNKDMSLLNTNASSSYLIFKISDLTTETDKTKEKNNVKNIYFKPVKIELIAEKGLLKGNETEDTLVNGLFMNKILRIDTAALLNKNAKE